MRQTPDLHEVASIIKETAALEVLPKFRSLRETEIGEKASGEIVTSADIACEQVLERRLKDCVPEAIFVGEESCGLDSIRLDRSLRAESFWLVDPVDGTSNFAAGKETFAVMVSFVRGGEICAGWIYIPLQDKILMAESGSGSWSGERRLRVGSLRFPASPSRDTASTRASGSACRDKPPRPDKSPRGMISAGRYVPPDLRVHFRAAAAQLQCLPTLRCAGAEYVRLLEKEADFCLFTKLLPWDHGAGVLLAQEAGATILCADRTSWKPGKHASYLLAASSRQLWNYLEKLFDPGRSADR